MGTVSKENRSIAGYAKASRYEWGLWTIGEHENLVCSTQWEVMTLFVGSF